MRKSVNNLTLSGLAPGEPPLENGSIGAASHYRESDHDRHPGAYFLPACQSWPPMFRPPFWSIWFSTSWWRFSCGFSLSKSTYVLDEFVAYSTAAITFLCLAYSIHDNALIRVGMLLESASMARSGWRLEIFGVGLTTEYRGHCDLFFLDQNLLA